MTSQDAAEKPEWQDLLERAVDVLAVVETVQSNSDWTNAANLWTVVEGLVRRARALSRELGTTVEAAEDLTSAPEPVRAVGEAHAILEQARTILQTVPALGSIQVGQAGNDAAIQRHWEQEQHANLAAQTAAQNVTPVLPPHMEP